MTASAKYLFYSLRQPQPQKMFPSTLVISNIIEVNNVNCLRTALCGGRRQTVCLLWLSWFIANRGSNMSEMLLEIGSSRPAVFCNKFHKKTSKVVFLFCKSVSSQACNCRAKRDTTTGVSLWIYLYECIFSFLPLCFKKNKSSHRRCSVKKGVLNFANFKGKHLCGSLFLIGLQARPENNYFEEHLWTTASKKDQYLFNSQSSFIS